MQATWGGEAYHPLNPNVAPDCKRFPAATPYFRLSYAGQATLKPADRKPLSKRVNCPHVVMAKPTSPFPTIHAPYAANTVVSTASWCDLNQMLVRNRCSDRRLPSHQSASVPVPSDLQFHAVRGPLMASPLGG